MLTLKQELKKSFCELKTSRPNQNKIQGFLREIERADRATLEHCLRVGIRCRYAAEALGEDPQTLFCAGLLHDCGKCRVARALLTKIGKFSPEERLAMQQHSVLGHQMLKGDFPYLAEVVVRCHYFQEYKPYPQILPKPAIHLTKARLQKIEREAKILALVDYYDALVSRHNGRFNCTNLLFIFRNNNKAMKREIETLLTARVISF